MVMDQLDWWWRPAPGNDRPATGRRCAVRGPSAAGATIRQDHCTRQPRRPRSENRPPPRATWPYGAHERVACGRITRVVAVVLGGLLIKAASPPRARARAVRLGSRTGGPASWPDRVRPAADAQPVRPSGRSRPNPDTRPWDRYGRLTLKAVTAGRELERVEATLSGHRQRMHEPPVPRDQPTLSSSSSRHIGLEGKARSCAINRVRRKSPILRNQRIERSELSPAKSSCCSAGSCFIERSHFRYLCNHHLVRPGSTAKPKHQKSLSNVNTLYMPSRIITAAHKAS